MTATAEAHAEAAAYSMSFTKAGRGGRRPIRLTRSEIIAECLAEGVGDNPAEARAAVEFILDHCVIQEGNITPDGWERLHNSDVPALSRIGWFAHQILAEGTVEIVDILA